LSAESSPQKSNHAKIAEWSGKPGRLPAKAYRLAVYNLMRLIGQMVLSGAGPMIPPAGLSGPASQLFGLSYLCETVYNRNWLAGPGLFIGLPAGVSLRP